ncbi:MAG: hypothetical protein AB7T06_42230 [Kofleriaceae bacterium]
MYNVGFGDAFLITVTGEKHPLKILVDCGSIAKGPHSMDAIVERIVDDVTDDDGVPRIDVVIATHRHRDHVSGFANDRWSNVNVREVWMPWTENPSDKEATRIRENQAKLAFGLATAFAPRLGAVSDEPEIEGWTNDQHQMALNALANEKAMATLHHGFSGKPVRRFLPLREDNAPIRLGPAMFHIVGPAFTEDVIRDMDPPVGQSYLAMASDGGRGTSLKLFDDYWAHDPAWGPLSKEEREKIEGASSDLTESALTSLEAAVNGTSLFVIMQVDDTNFVFPGDAQWGTWKAVRSNPAYREMLAATKFYKVGHHGSHNATPVDFVEELGDDVIAMTSVRPIKKWKEIPRAPLLEALHEHGVVARADDLERLDKAFAREKDGFWIETSISTGTPPRKTVATATTKKERARAFLASIQLPLPSPTFGFGFTADPATDVAFDSAKTQAAVVGSDVVAFAKGVTDETRKDIVHATLLAQLVAKKRVPQPMTLDDWATWHGVYFDTLTNIGFVAQDHGFASYQARSDSFEAHEEIIALATVLFGAGTTALIAITKTLEALQKMDEASPWITLFDRESRSANTARFQATIAAPDDAAGRVLLSTIAFGLEAKTLKTQVLFFKFKSQEVTLKNYSGKVSIDSELLADVREAVHDKIAAHANKFVRALPEL